MGHASLLGYARGQNRVRMPTRIKVVLAVLFTAGVGIFVALAFIGGGNPGCDLPDGLEEVYPDCNSSVLGQTQVGVRVADGYTAELALNDVPIPLDRVTSGGQTGVEGGNLAGAAQMVFLFQPTVDDAEFALRPTNHMTVRYWPIAQGEEDARTYTWFFSAT
jgi:hypothetical protein